MLTIVLASVAIAVAQPAPAVAATVWAVGDGGSATTTRDDALGDFIASKRPLGQLDRFLYLGDIYRSGGSLEFYDDYHPAFGDFRDISSPTPGNNEWETNRMPGYDLYWGSLAPKASGGGRYYSFDVDGWHIISLNSNESRGPGSAQLRWLQNDLASYSGTCTIAMVHHPRYFAYTPPSPTASPTQPDSYAMEALWATLAGNSVAMLSGHIHNYQRLASERGITQLIVGTGGQENLAVAPDSAARVLDSEARTGALRLTLEPGSGRFDFFASGGSAPLDSTTLGCTAHASANKAPPPASPMPPRPGTPAATSAPPARTTSQTASTSTPPGFATPTATTASTGSATISLRRPSGVTRRRGFTVRGRSQGAHGAIRLSLVRRVGRRCQSFDGRRFRRSSCRARLTLRARGRRSFSYRFRRPLPRGSYLLSARVVDARGRVAWASRRLTVR